MLMLSAICHFARIALFIETMPHPGSSTEHVFRAYRVVLFPDHILKDDLGQQQPKSGIWYEAKHRKQMCILPGEVL